MNKNILNRKLEEDHMLSECQKLKEHVCPNCQQRGHGKKFCKLPAHGRANALPCRDPRSLRSPETAKPMASPWARAPVRPRSFSGRSQRLTHGSKTLTDKDVPSLTDESQWPTLSSSKVTVNNIWANNSLIKKIKENEENEKLKKDEIKRFREKKAADQRKKTVVKTVQKLLISPPTVNKLKEYNSEDEDYLEQDASSTRNDDGDSYYEQCMDDDNYDSEDNSEW